jgi:hypothetical protein
MQEFATPLGNTELDKALTRDFVVVTGDSSVRAAIAAMRARAPQTKYFFSYLLVSREHDGWAVIRWPEFEQLACDIGYAILDFTMHDALAAWPSVAAVTRGALPLQQIRDLLKGQPGQRLVVLEQGVPVGVFASNYRGAEEGKRLNLLDPPPAAARAQPSRPEVAAQAPTPQTAASPPVQRQINAWIDGDKGQPQRPLAVQQRYILHLDIGPPREASLVQGAAVGDLRELADSPQQTAVDVTFLLLADDTQLEILGPSEYTLPVPLQSGATTYEALFQIRPLVTGAVPLLMYVQAKGQVLQQLELTLTVAPHEAAQPTEPLPQPFPERVVAQGYTLDSIARLRERNNPINLLIAPAADGGYHLTLVGGVTMHATIRMTPAALAEHIRDARDALCAVVHLQDGGARLYQQGWDIDLEVHAQSLSKLAQVGRVLFEALFFDSGTESSAAALGRRLQELSRTRMLNITVVGRNFVFPWALVYDRPVGEPLNARGFWGFSHIVQHLPDSGTPSLTAFDPEIVARGGLQLAFVFNPGIDRQLGRALIADQRAFFATLGSAVVAEYSSEDELLALLDNTQNTAQVLYLYCHAESIQPGQIGASGLQQGASDSRLVLTPGTPGITVRDLERRSSRTLQMGSAPLVFLNACQGAALSPLLYQGLVPFFIRKGARGVLGTEVDTPAVFAAEFAKRFFARFVSSGKTMGQLLLELRQEFLHEHNNLLPLVYALYSSGDISVVRA